MSVSATVPQSAPSTVSGLSEFTGQIKSRAEATAGKRTDTQPQRPEASAPAGTDLKKVPEPGKTDVTDPADKGEKVKPVKTIEQLTEELSSQSKANLRLGKELAAATKMNKELLDTTKRLEAKFDGTHKELTPEEDQEKRAKEAFDGYLARQNAGRPDIVAEVGEDVFVQAVEAENSKFRQIAAKKPHLARRIMDAENPSREAWKVTQEESIFEEFGSTRASMLAKAKDVLRDELFKEFEKEKKPDKSSPAPSLRQTRPSGESAQGGDARPFSVSQMFRHTV